MFRLRFAISSFLDSNMVVTDEDADCVLSNRHPRHLFTSKMARLLKVAAIVHSLLKADLSQKKEGATI